MKRPHGKSTHIFRTILFIAAFAMLAGCATSTGGVVSGRSAAEMYEIAVAQQTAGKYERAEAELKRLMEDFPLSAYAVEAQLLLGDLYYSTERYEDAGSYYTNFVAMHPSHPRAPYALFQKGMSYLKDILTIDRDQTTTRKALFAFEDLVADYPDCEYIDRTGELIAFLKNRLAEREFYVARFYYKKKNYEGALGRLRDLLKKYPAAGFTEESLYYMGESYYRLGEAGLAREAYSTLIENFPESSFAADARTRLDGLG